MDKEARLMQALGGPAAPARDPAFTLAVLRAAEARRFRTEVLRSALAAAGMAAAAAALAAPLLGWAAANWQGLQSGVALALALAAGVGAARLAGRRASAVLAG